MSNDPDLNNTIQDRYQLKRLLGKGAKGSVYEAYDASMRRTVAIKLNAKKSSEKDQVRFQLEAKALAKLKHPNIVQVSDFGLHDQDNCYLVMELAPGIDLFKIIDEQFESLPAVSIEILKQICMAMQHAHEKGVLHRDLKPANVIVSGLDTGDPSCKLVDFGLAKLKEDGFQTDGGPKMGTPPYMSPEQIKGKTVGKTSDIYSFGCLMYEVLTGSKAFQGRSSIETHNLHLSKQAPKLEEANRDIKFEPELEEIVAKCLMKDPDQRFENFQDVLDAFDTIQSNQEEVKDDLQDKPGSRVPVKLIIASSFTLALFGLSFFYFNKFESKKNIDNSNVQSTPKKKGFMYEIVSDNDSILTDTECHRPALEKDALPALRKEIGDRKINRLTLNLSQFTGEELKYFTDLPIKYLSISTSELGDGGLLEIGNMSQLEELKLNKDSNLTHKGLRHLKKLKRLYSLSMVNSSLDDKCMEQIAGIPNLNILIVTKNPGITSKGWGYLAKSPNIRVLELGQQKLSGADLSVFARMKQLKALRFQQVEGFTRKQLLGLGTKLPSTKIYVSEYSRIDLVDYENLFPDK